MTFKDQSLRSLVLFAGLPFFLGCQGDLVGPEEGGLAAGSVRIIAEVEGEIAEAVVTVREP